MDAMPESNMDDVEMEHDGGMYSDEEDGPGDPNEEAIEVPEAKNEEGKIIKPKRIVKNPQPKLDYQRLNGPRGIWAIENTFKDIKFKGKGYEKEDLNMLMKKLEHWAHRLFPKSPFDDTLKQIEELGNKKPVQNMMQRIRLDMYQSDELREKENPQGDDETNEAATEVDVFDELLGTGPFAPKESELSRVNENSLNVSVTNSQPTSSVLSIEQRERIERNRKLALEKRNARLREQKGQMGKEDELKNIGSPSHFIEGLKTTLTNRDTNADISNTPFCSFSEDVPLHVTESSFIESTNVSPKSSKVTSVEDESCQKSLGGYSEVNPLDHNSRSKSVSEENQPINDSNWEELNKEILPVETDSIDTEGDILNSSSQKHTEITTNFGEKSGNTLSNDTAHNTDNSVSNEGEPNLINENDPKSKEAEMQEDSEEDLVNEDDVLNSINI